MRSWAAAKHKTKNCPSYNTARKQRGSLSILFDRETVWVPSPGGTRGRQRQFSDAAIQTCRSQKVLFDLPLRKATGFLESLLRLIGPDGAVPDFSTLCGRQRTLQVNIPDRGGTGPMNLLIDGTGLRFEGDGEWSAEDQETVRWIVFPINAQARRPQMTCMAQDTYRD